MLSKLLKLISENRYYTLIALFPGGFLVILILILINNVKRGKK